MCGQLTRGIQRNHSIQAMTTRVLPPDELYKSQRIAMKNGLTVNVFLKRNEKICEIVWKLIRVFELNLRFHVNHHVTSFTNNQDWRQDPNLMLSQHLSRAPSNHDTYRSMSLGFLCLLFSNRYHNKLWVPCLQDSLPSWTLPRRELHRRFKVLVRVRNRIAHHEIIYNYPLIEIIEFAQELLVDINQCAAEEIRKGNYTETINKIRLGSGGGI